MRSLLFELINKIVTKILSIRKLITVQIDLPLINLNIRRTN